MDSTLVLPKLFPISLLLDCAPSPKLFVNYVAGVFLVSLFIEASFILGDGLKFVCVRLANVFNFGFCISSLRLLGSNALDCVILVVGVGGCCLEA